MPYTQGQVTVDSNPLLLGQNSNIEIQIHSHLAIFSLPAVGHPRPAKSFDGGWPITQHHIFEKKSTHLNRLFFSQTLYRNLKRIFFFRIHVKKPRD
jgi:hypothetical protein